MKRLNSLSLVIASAGLLISCAHQSQPQDFKIVDTKIYQFDAYKNLGIQGSDDRARAASAKLSGKEASEFLSSEFYLKAADCSVRGEFSKALEYYKLAFDLTPHNQFVLKKLTIELIRLGDLDTAKSYLEKEVSLKAPLGEDEGNALLLAGIYSALDMSSSAREVYQKIITEGKNIQEACLFLSRQLASDKKNLEAQSILAKCQSKDSQEPMYAFYRGKFYQDGGDLVKAKSFYEKALKLDPDFYQAALGVGSIF